MMARRDVNLYWLRPDELSAYRGHAFLSVDTKGSITSGTEGFYFRRTRFLSRLRLKIAGEEPTFASANTVEAHSLISYHLAPSPAAAAAGPKPGDDEEAGGEIARKGIEIQISRFVGGGLHQDIHVTNRAMADTTATLAWEVAADFADQEEATSGKRQQTAPVTQEWAQHPNGGEVRFHYRHPKLDHCSIVRFTGPGEFTEGMGVVSCRLDLKAGETRTLGIDVIPSFLGEKIEPFYGLDGASTGDGAADRLRRNWNEGCARLRASHPVVQAAWDRAAADLSSLHLLEGEGEEALTPAAGAPKYIALFGRDALMASWQSAMLNPATLTGTLRLVGKWNATETDDKFDAQPGKVLHQRQLSPLAYHLGTVWPFANAIAGYGLKRYGFAADLHRLAKGQFEATELFHLSRLPEVFGGHPRDRRHPHPGVYPAACAPQAWSASAIVFLIHAMLGLIPLAPLDTLIVDPQLPDWLPEISLEGLRVGNAVMSLRFRRDASGYTSHDVVDGGGGLRIHRLQRRDGSGGDRVAAAIREVIEGQRLHGIGQHPEHDR